MNSYDKNGKHYCPEHGLELEVSYEKNRYYIGHHWGEPLLIGEDFDTKTGEHLYCLVGRCPIKKPRFLPFLEPQDSHYIFTIKTDAKIAKV